MFTFRCPACGKLHTAPADLAAPFEARCLRCGDAFEVSADLAHAARTSVQPAPAGASAGGPASAETPPRPEGMAVGDPLPLAEDGAIPPPETGGRPRKGRRYRGQDDEDTPRPDEDGSDADDGDSTPPGPHHEAREEVPPAPNAAPWYKRPPVLIGIAAAVVLLAGGAGTAYFLMGGKAKPTKKEVAKTNKPAPKAAPRPTAKEPEPKPAVLETPKPRSEPDVFISAPRLAAELAANQGMTDVRYKDKLLEVSGLFDGTGTRAKPPPQGTHAFFRTDGPRVSADLAGSPANAKARQGLVVGEPMTVRGVYDADGVLRHAELRPETPPADAEYRGKEVEVVGYVDAVKVGDDSATAFPTIRLEGETFSRIAVECLFRKADAAELRKVPPGALVTIGGTCSGRRREQDRYVVRLDNCRFVYTTAPTPPTRRVEVAQFLRDYGEDLRRDLLPPAGSEERLDALLTATQLARDAAADRQSLEKYRGKVLTVQGRLLERTRDGGVLLEGEDTDKAFRVLCHFSARNLRLLGSDPVLRVRGLCTGLADGPTLRLEDCEPYDPAPDRRRLTADCLPHIPGRVLTYDLAAWPADGGKPVVVRQNFVEAEGGLIETLTTHRGTLAGHSLFDPGEQERWVAQPKTRKVRLPGDVFFQRQSGSFVEVGQRILDAERKVQVVWQPVLKVGARQGESWTWEYAGTEHTWTVEKFEERDARSAAVVAERVVLGGDDAHPVLVRHVYVRDVGEVERQDVMQLTRKETRVTAEKKLVAGTTGESKAPPGPPRGGN